MTARTLDTISNEMNMLSKEISKLQSKYSKLRKEKELIRPFLLQSVYAFEFYFPLNQSFLQSNNPDYKAKRRSWVSP